MRVNVFTYLPKTVHLYNILYYLCGGWLESTNSKGQICVLIKDIANIYYFIFYVKRYSSSYYRNRLIMSRFTSGRSYTIIYITL